MKPRTTLIVVALFALLAGYVYLFELNKTPEQLSAQLGTPTAKPPQYVLQLNARNVTSLEVADLRAPREVKLTRAGDAWQVNQPTEKAADDGVVESTLGSLANLSAARVLTNVVDLAPFGLVTPTLEARVIMSDSQQYALTLGNKSPDNRYYYAVYTGDKARVFLVDTTVVETLKGWLDTPPYQPTPTPTATPEPAATGTPTLLPTAAPPNIAPTIPATPMP